MNQPNARQPALPMPPIRIPPTLRITFGVLETCAPWLGARLAERLWLTLPLAGRPSTNSLPASDRLDLPSPAGAVASYAWGSGPNIYLVHGWGGRATQMSSFIKPLVESGYRVIAFDHLSHGNSAPGSLGARRSIAPEFIQTITHVVTELGPAHTIIAHSVGALATALSLREGITAKRLVFLSPMSNPIPLTRGFAKTFGFGERIRTGFIANLERRVDRRFDYFDVPSVAGDVAVPETLLVHDRLDTETLFSDSEQIAAAWPGSTLVSTEGLGHRRILRSAAVVASVVDFVNSTNELANRRK